MNDVLFELLKLIVMIAVLLIMRYAIPWIRSRIGVEKMAEIEKMGRKGSSDGTAGLLGKVRRRAKGNRNEVFTGNADCEKYFNLRGAVKYSDRSRR